MDDKKPQPSPIAPQKQDQTRPGQAAAGKSPMDNAGRGEKGMDQVDPDRPSDRDADDATNPSDGGHDRNDG
jgi:hypothetical protein